MPQEEATFYAEPAPRLRHIPALDGVRGLAVLLVLAEHLLRANTNTGNFIFDFFSAISRACWVGVDLFFVLSGFLITGILYDSLGNDGYFKKFYGRRVLRIFPLYYGVLFLLLALTRPLNLHWSGSQWMLLLYLQNTGLGGKTIFDYSPSVYIGLGTFWSLAVEEQFYLVWPLLVFWIKDLKRLLVATIGFSFLALLLRIVLMSKGVSSTFIYSFTACRADSLLLGGCLALLMRSQWRERVLKSAIPVLALALAVTATVAVRHGGFYDWRDGYFIETGGYTIVALGCAALIAETFRKTSWLRPLFELSGLRFMGKYSYGIYVFHWSVYALLSDPLRVVLLRYSHSRLVSVLGSAALVTAVSVLIAMASFHLYEKRFLSLKKYFDYEGLKRVPSGGRAALRP